MDQTNHFQLTEALIGSESAGQRQLDAVLQVTEAMGRAKNVPAAIDLVAEYVGSLFDTKAAVLLLHDTATNGLWTYLRDTPGGWPRRLVMSGGDSFVQRVYATQEALRIDSAERSVLVSNDEASGNPQSFGFTIRSVIAAPLMRQGAECAGVLAVLDDRESFFDDDDLTLLQALVVPVAIGVEHAGRFEAQQRQLIGLARALSGAIELRNAMSRASSVNVANYAMGIGVVLGLAEHHIESLQLAALLHDVGTLGTPGHVLLKSGLLEAHETTQVRKHALYVRQILRQVDFAPPYEDTAELAAAHHEKLDGSGYPEGLTGNQVPLKVRVLTVADMFHALTQPRPYREGLEIGQALSVLDDHVPHQLDGRCVDALKAFLGIGCPPPPAA